MVEYIIIVGLSIGAGYWILRPLLADGDYRDFDESFPGDAIREKYITRKENAYAAIRELEFDLNMGKLSQEDFQALTQQYTQEAIECLKEIDGMESAPENGTSDADGSIEAEIEREVATIRSGKSLPYRFCAACGEKVLPENRFCSSCGTRLPDRGAVIGKEAMEEC